MTHHRNAVAIIAFGLTVLSGCTTTPAKLTVPAGLAVPERVGVDESARPAGGQPQEQRELRQTQTPTRDLAATVAAGQNIIDSLPPMNAEPVSVNVQNLPIPVFADEVFGNMLGLNVSIDPAVSQLQELVTLHTTERQPPRELFHIARQVLAEYGVLVSIEGRIVRIKMGAKDASPIPPLVVSGRALPAVPISHRPVFQLIELEVVRSGDAARWLTTLFGEEIKVTEDSIRNAVLINGKPAQIRQAIDALRVFDRPLMRGRKSTRLEPAFMTAEQLADRLVEVLNVQGYGASRSLGAPSSVLIVPIQAVNSILVFAVSQDVLDYAVSWARELDKPNAAAGAQSMFYYQVKNTKAAELSQVLSGSMSLSNAQQANQGGTSQAAAQGGAPAPAPQTSSGRVAGLLVDEPRNALIYQGDPAQWERLLTLIRQMDRAPRQVMVEVTIAEVTLEDGDQFGVSWLAKNGFGRFDGNALFGSLPGSGNGNGNGSSSSNGLTYLLDVAGQNRLALTAFANDNRVSILSTPRLLVKSGSEANIDIGTEVPTITMTTTSNQQTEGNTNLLQSIQYRKTGIILRVKPTVYSDDRIDLDITQEVSEALPIGDNAAISSPSIFNRSLNTSLSLRDGGSVVMAGLMSERNTKSDSGIPLIKDVPILGNLFKSQSRNKNKTELVLMIVPYIVESDDRMTAISQAVVDKFELLELQPATGTIPNTSPARGMPTSKQPH
ncbi:type II secretion system protein GspD [Aerolutibacter ruishenii]|uniref:General secretion pathway protein D n=1 Tax=Aerolutibacter ruishenii TaxID=686800 RepID=A0A562M2X8_9GAMM|nr:type II secretion system protein GspD [Lysobacter ruishenii]TWI14279.1 general secretion pathway protein D [Lysobacter ruishenii]